MCNDDDFHFEFDDLEIDHTALMMIELDDEYFIGHLKDDAEGRTWMEGAHLVDELDDGMTVELLEVPRFLIDPLQEVIVICNADEMRLLHTDLLLNLGHINDIPMLFNSTRH
ncbi:hypothetical protein pEaSNUABM14_00213 [Erwinia phage pEa_SNUABM_14]|nr:hypothetical protein pEaSNUABM13_00214 [Erwinia phage pEa_SNUABM_13]QYW03514.1 hypothetical protein pEaSNUABM34_00212 [Erwinia phage pEa_SNUABM_34]QYW03856.1 hypothetical protein pEaSNUABM45_00213 [Erwinia phage pEa_SNUABM_45]QYW04197.1 hypothetical protein pEaSNUABM46_00213 [Erwinia phage pEa_SNUABM_46]QYW04538.1 hypothetical protein pEaSNUABM14_00213 [Erwinia phage pEa_SNUABM_14]QYW05227.1 hypothetical protein pEaSNUABM21_00213 [Erwinia phage pEa_SNUABM_21]